VVATLEHTTKHELPDDFVSWFRAAAIWTTGGGKRLVDRDEIAAPESQSRSAVREEIIAAQDARRLRWAGTAA
jgi:hypothetical protein